MLQRPTAPRPHWLKSLTTMAVALAIGAPAFADELSDIQKLLKSGQAAEALQRTDRALASNPKDAQLRFVRGVILAEQGKHSDAIAVFVKLTDDYPELPEPYNNLAVLYANQNQYDKARTALEMAIRTNPSYATAYENLGDVYAKLASQAYSKALQIDGGNAAVPPKLALIRELFTHKSRAGASTQVAAAAPQTQPRPTAAPTPPVVATAPGPAPLAPAPAPKAPAPTPAPPIPAPAAAAAAVDATAQVRAVVLDWAQAWSRKDVSAYFASYSTDFSAGKSRKAWEDERRARIAGKKSISVKVSDLDIAASGDKATARFRQDYAADALKVSSRKTLELARQGGKWVIVKESTGS